MRILILLLALAGATPAKPEVIAGYESRSEHCGPRSRDQERTTHVSPPPRRGHRGGLRFLWRRGEGGLGSHRRVPEGRQRGCPEPDCEQIGGKQVAATAIEAASFTEGTPDDR